MLKNNKITNTDRLLYEFLDFTKRHISEAELYKVLKSRTYKISEANVLIRTASEGNRNYFFGINYLTIEEISNLENPFIAFICGSIKSVLILPAKLLFRELHNISHDRNGEYKINIDKELNIILKGRGNRLSCKNYINNWDILKESSQKSGVYSNPEESLHSVLQGRIIDIGNIRGFKTYCPDKSKKFNDKALVDLTTLRECPELQFSDHNLLRNIDVLWFEPKGKNLVPAKAFEVELSTGTWSGVGRMSTLLDYSNVNLYVISNDKKKFKQVLGTLPLIHDRFTHIDSSLIGELYSAELQLKELRLDIGL